MRLLVRPLVRLNRQTGQANQVRPRPPAFRGDALDEPGASHCIPPTLPRVTTGGVS